LYSLPNIRVVKSQRVRWARYVARTGGLRIHTNNWSGHLKGRDHLEDLSVDGRVTLERDIMEIGWEGVDFIHLAQGRYHWCALLNTLMNLQVT
jgi:hypothetical protein